VYKAKLRDSPPEELRPAERLTLNSLLSHLSSRDPREENWATKGAPWK